MQIYKPYCASRDSFLIAMVLLIHCAIGLFFYFSEAKINAAPVLGKAFVSYPFQSDGDSWKPMGAALKALAQGKESVYESVLHDSSLKFQYPPSSLILYDISSRLVGEDHVILLLDSLSWVAIMLLAGVVAFLHIQAYPLCGYSIQGKKEILLRFVLILFAALAFFPLERSFVLGQVQSLLILLFSVALLAYVHKKDAIAGCCVGLMCLFKPHMVLIILLAIARRKWRFGLSVIAIVLVGQVVSIVLYGIDIHLDYAKFVQFIGQRGEVFVGNQSVNGFINRLVSQTGDFLQWRVVFPPYNPVVHIFTLVNMLLMLFVMIFPFPRGKSSVELDALDFSLAFLAITLASPIAWVHHHAVLLPILALTAPILCLQKKGRIYFVLLSLIYLIAGQNTLLLLPFINSYVSQNLLLLTSFSMLLILLFARWKYSTSMIVHKLEYGAELKMVQDDGRVAVIVKKYQ